MIETLISLIAARVGLWRGRYEQAVNRVDKREASAVLGELEELADLLVINPDDIHDAYLGDEEA